MINFKNYKHLHNQGEKLQEISSMLRHINILAEIIASQPNNLTYDNGFLEYVSVSKGKQKYAYYCRFMVKQDYILHFIIAHIYITSI